ncbi:MAG TPA: MFS transporter [Steroidobacteraceae bacterium]|nr:MFS transporter [Steroidobacteraceae bacterium]
MNATATTSAVSRPGWRLPPRAAFVLQASLTVGFLAGASAPTPLYPLYQAQWGFSSLAVTVIFGIYALTVLATLLLLGRLSDHIGRRPVLLAATLAQALSMLMFARADGLHALLAARVLQGLAAGAALAAIGAGLLDLDRERGAIANAVTPPIGTGLGGLVSGLVVRLLPAPTHAIYLLFGALFVVQGIALLFMDETMAPRGGALASLKPQLRLSSRTRAPLLRAAPAIIASWSVAGFFAALGPAMVRNVLGVESPLLAGLAVFVFASSGAVAVLLSGRRDPRRMLALGAAALLAGVVVVFTALPRHSPPLLFAGSIVAGVGFGAGFQGAVRGVLATASATERAGVVAVVFIIAYLAMGLPAMGAGYLLTHGGGLAGTMRDFAALVAVLAGAALFGSLRGAAASARG